MYLPTTQPAQAAVKFATAPATLTPTRAIRLHWREYAMEAAGLGWFMVSACLFCALYENPASPVRQAIASPAVRRLLLGLFLGLTAISIIYLPLGKQSQAPINPA